MNSNDIIREHIFEIVKNQIKSNNPPETKATLDRLRKQGFDDSQAKQMIAQCVSVEIFEVMKYRKPYNNERYIKNLNALSKEPFD